MAYVSYLEEEKIKISRGMVKDASFIHKFGAVPAMSQSANGTIWDKNDTIYPWSAWNTASNVNVDAASASDVGKHITVVGLDDNYNQMSETITLVGQNNNYSSNTFSRIFRAFVSDGEANAGTITIQKNSTDVAIITTTFSQTLMAIYTVPAGYTGYIYKGTSSAQAGADGTAGMFIRYFGQTSFRIGHSFEVSGAGGQYTYDFSFPIPVPEKSDIDVRITTRTNNGRYTAAFDLLLVKNS
jgi:hypothetical protein